MRGTAFFYDGTGRNDINEFFDQVCRLLCLHFFVRNWNREYRVAGNLKESFLSNNALLLWERLRLNPPLTE